MGNALFLGSGVSFYRVGVTRVEGSEPSTETCGNLLEQNSPLLYDADRFVGLSEPTQQMYKNLKRHFSKALLVTLFVCGCPPDEGPERVGFEEQVFDASGDASFPTELTRETGAEKVDLVDGIWLHYSQLATCVDVGSQSFDNLNRTLYIVDVTQDEFGIAEETWLGCDVVLSPVLNLVPALRRENLEVIYPVVTEGGLAATTTIGAGYASPPVAELWGLELENPLTDALPVSAEDDRIIDSDDDGNPGATLVFGTNICEAFVTQRTSAIYSGRFVTFDRIEGIAVSTTEQFVIDASTSFCRTRYMTRPNDERSTFARQRIDGQGGSLNLDTDRDGTITCEDLLAGEPSYEVLIEALFDFLPLDDDVCYE